MEYAPPDPTIGVDPEAWAMAVARELMELYRSHGRAPILVWPDPDNPGVAVVGRRKTVDVATKVVVHSP